MFRLNRSKPAKSGEPVDFRFYNFKALQVPKGWDKLSVYMISVDTGKTIAKSSKAFVQNESCQWKDTLSASIWLPPNETLKELDDYIFKFAIAMGSGRSGILGEAILNMTSYISSSDPVSVSWPLKKSNNGTILQVMIHCLTPRIKLRDEESKEMNSHVEDVKVDYCDPDVKSDVSDSLTSSSSKDTSSAFSATHPGEPESREASFSVSSSHHSEDSAGGFLSREVLSPTINLSSNALSPGRDSSKSNGNYPVRDASQSQQSYFNSRRSGSGNHSLNNRREHSTSPLKVSSSSKILLEAAEGAIEELRAEAKMWERNARKLMLDLDMLRKEHSDLSKTNKDLDKELSEACKERDGLRKETEQLTLLLETPSVKPTAKEKELDDEIKFLKESNANLAMQLKRTQESNIEFVSLVQELELEKSIVQSKSNDMENSMQEKMEENKELSIQLQQMQESDKHLQVEVQMLKAKLSESVKETHAAEMNAANLNREIEALQNKVHELERDCNELTEENLELVIRLKEVNNKSTVETKQKVSQEVNQNKKLLGETEDSCDFSVQKLKSSKLELELKVNELGTELNSKRSEIAKLEADLMSKEEAISDHRQSQTELEVKIAGLEKEKIDLEKSVETGASEVTSECSNHLPNNTHVSSNKMLDRESLGIIRGKDEFQLRLSELKEENVQLLECISSLEAQLRHLTNENETGRLELEHFKSLAGNLQDDIKRLRKGTDTQKVGLKQKLQYMQSKWSEFEEEFEHLRKANPVLQATVDNLIEECSSILKLNDEFRDQNPQLHENCTKLEARLWESSKRFSECSQKVEILESNLSSILEDIASQEKSLASKLDSLLEENMTHKENLIRENKVLNELYLEKKLEAETLQQNVLHLMNKISATSGERDQAVHDAMHEVSCLREDKGKLESSLIEFQSKVRRTDNELNAVRIESNETVERLKAELSAVRQNQEMMMADYVKVQNLMENYKASEEKLKSTVNNLESKLNVSEHERQQLLEETSQLNLQVQKITLLQDEVFTLQNEIFTLQNELIITKFEKEKLEASSHLLSGECEEVKAENQSFKEKISSLQTAVSAFEDCKEKLMHVESDLNRISRANNQCQKKIQQLEKDKDDYMKKSHTLEEELKLMKEEKHNERDCSSVKVHNTSKTNAKVSPVREDLRLPRSETMKSTNHHYDSWRKLSLKSDQLQELVKDRQKSHNIQHQKEGGNGSSIHVHQHTQTGDADSLTKIQFLEIELSKAIEATNTYKAQLHRLVSEDLSSHTEGELVPKERFERTKSLLEAELKEIRERYLHMSLQYAEVEAEREELVMKLKASENGKRWFS